MNTSTLSQTVPDVPPTTKPHPFTKQRTQRVILLTVWVVLAAVPLIGGYDYYRSPLQERPHLEAHDTFKPSGLIGQGLGILGSLMMLFGVVSYMVRKRWAVLARFGTLRTWLTFHIFLCTLGPYYVLLHTTFKFGNISSISFWSMAVVVASGIFGRYVYIHIPKGANGQFYSPQDLRRAQESLIKRVAAQTGVHPQKIVALIDRAGPTKGIFEAIYKSIRFTIRKRGMAAYFEKHLSLLGVPAHVIREAIPLLEQNASLQLRRRILGPFVRVFGYWHVFHIPISLVMLVALIIHIAVAIMFGYTWIF